MIDLTNLKAPGWQRVVAELSAGAPDDKTFFERLMQVLAQVSAARRATLWLPTRTDGEEIEPVSAAVWPVNGGAGIESTISAEYEAAAKNAARAAFSSGAARAFGLDKETPYYEGAPGQGYILAVALPGIPAAGRPDGGAASGPSPSVITLLIEPRSRDAIRSTLAMAEVLAGYVHVHGTKQHLRRTQAASFAFDLATRLVASINTAPNFRGAVLQLTNDLAKQFGVDRVALGWVRTDAVRVEAISDTEHFDRRMAMVQRLQSAMDECLDQEQPVMFPQPPADGPGSDVLLSQAIVHAHRELAAGDARIKVCSMPLRVDERVVGVVTIESTGAGNIDLTTIELIQAALDLVSPVLRIRKSDDRALPLRAYDSGVKASAWLVGPRHTVWKIVSVLVFIAAIFVTFYRTTYRVSAEAILQPRTKRVISAPFDGVVRSLADDLEPGKMVKAGELLVQLDTTELELSRNDARAKIFQAATQEAAALHDKDSGAAEKARAQMAQAQAQVDYIDYRIERSAITSPIDGVIIAGDLKSRVNGTIKLGDPMLEIAQMEDIIAVAQVDDRDIWLVKRAFDEHGGTDTGAIVTKSQPGAPFSLRVERIVPLANAKEGKNTFEVRARIDDPAPWMVPGTEGIAKFDTRRASLLWIGTRRVVDAVRLWLW